jgi:hypothetical protein
MASLTATITLNTTDATSDALKISNVKTLTTTIPAINIARLEVATGAATNILTTAANTSITYVYLKNTDTTAANTLDVMNDAGNSFATLGAGESMFLPIKAATGLEVQADTAAVTIEYGYWTAS